MKIPILLSTVTEIDQIATHSNPVIRNLQITQCYHELSAVLARRTGPGANWCTFATWGIQAGRADDSQRVPNTGAGKRTQH